MADKKKRATPKNAQLSVEDWMKATGYVPPVQNPNMGILDRIEGDYGVVEMPGMWMKNVPMDRLGNAKEGASIPLSMIAPRGHTGEAGPVQMPAAWGANGRRLSPQQVLNMWNNRSDADIMNLFGSESGDIAPSRNEELYNYLMSEGMMGIPSAVDAQGVTIPMAQVQRMYNGSNPAAYMKMMGQQMMPSGLPSDPTRNLDLMYYYDNLPEDTVGWQE